MIRRLAARIIGLYQVTLERGVHELRRQVADLQARIDEIERRIHE